MYEAPGESGKAVFAKGCSLATKFKSTKSYRKNEKVCSGLLRQLNQLEWLDALCAEPDRHPGNMIFDNKSVTGIDNDICLYPFPDIIESSSASNNQSDSDAEDSDSRSVSPRNSRNAGCLVGYPWLLTGKL